MLLAKLAIAVLMFTFVVGCNRVSSPTGVAGVGHDHDHGGEKHPESLAEAIDAIAKSGKRILDAFKSGNPDDAHDELHDIGHLIESLPALGADPRSELDNRYCKRKVDGRLWQTR